MQLSKAELDQMIANTEAVKRGVLIVGTIVLVLSTFAAFAATYQLKTSDATVTLHDSQCGQPWLDGWKRASMTYRGKDFEACWMHQEGVIFLLDSAGDLTPLPVNAFKKLAEG